MRECGVVLQFCLAHLIRDVKFLTTLPDARDRAYGERLREALRELFGVIHRREQLSAEAFQSQLEAARDEVLRAGTQDVPETRHRRNWRSGCEKHGESYFRFVTTPGVEPTNNLAEQAIRFVVIDRHITQGTRSEAGQPLVRADLDGDRDVRSARTFGVRVPGGGGRGVVRWDRGPVAVTRRLRGAERRRCRWSAQVQGPVGPGSPEGRTPVTALALGLVGPALLEGEDAPLLDVDLVARRAGGRRRPPRPG